MLLVTKASGVLISCATPATIWPSAESFSACTSWLSAVSRFLRACRSESARRWSCWFRSRSSTALARCCSLRWTTSSKAETRMSSNCSRPARSSNDSSRKPTRIGGSSAGPQAPMADRSRTRRRPPTICPGARASAQKLAEAADDLLRGTVLGEEAVGAALEAAKDVQRVGLAGADDDRDPPPPGIGLEPPAQVEAAVAGQVQVAEHEVERS